MMLEYKGPLKKILIIRFCVFFAIACLIFWAYNDYYIIDEFSPAFSPTINILVIIFSVYAICANIIATVLECCMYKCEKSLRDAGFDTSNDSVQPHNGGQFLPTSTDAFYNNAEMKTKIKRLDIIIGIPVMSGLLAISLIVFIYSICIKDPSIGFVSPIIIFTWHIIKFSRKCAASIKVDIE